MIPPSDIKNSVAFETFGIDRCWLDSPGASHGVGVAKLTKVVQPPSEGRVLYICCRRVIFRRILSQFCVYGEREAVVRTAAYFVDVTLETRNLLWLQTHSRVLRVVGATELALLPAAPGVQLSALVVCENVILAGRQLLNVLKLGDMSRLCLDVGVFGMVRKTDNALLALNTTLAESSFAR